MISVEALGHSLNPSLFPGNECPVSSQTLPLYKHLHCYQKTFPFWIIKTHHLWLWSCCVCRATIRRWENVLSVCLYQCCSDQRDFGIGIDWHHKRQYTNGFCLPSLNVYTETTQGEAWHIGKRVWFEIGGYLPFVSANRYQRLPLCPWARNFILIALYWFGSRNGLEPDLHKQKC